MLFVCGACCDKNLNTDECSDVAVAFFFFFLMLFKWGLRNLSDANLFWVLCCVIETLQLIKKKKFLNFLFQDQRRVKKYQSLFYSFECELSIC